MWCGYNTGWDLGPFAEALAARQMLPHFKYISKIQRNKGKKKKAVHMHRGKLWTIRHKKTKKPKKQKKPSTATFKEPRAKSWC